MTADLFNPASYSYSLYAAPNMVAALTMLGLGLVVLVSERYSRVSVSFFVMIMTAAVWLFSYSIMYCAQTEAAAAAWARAGHTGITFIPAAVYHFTLHTLQLERKYKNRVRFVWLACATFFAIMFWSDAFFDAVRRHWWGYYPLYGWAGILFIGFFFCLMALSLRHYWMAYQTVLLKSTRLRSKALLTAFCIAYVASIDFLPTFDFSFYPFGHTAILGFVAMVAVAIRRHRLVDITPAFAAREIINAMDDALLVFDNDGIVRVTNRAASRLFGRSESDLEGLSAGVLATFFASPAPALDQSILAGSLRDCECLLRAQQPDQVTVSISSSLMKDQDDRPVASVCIVRDITQQKQTQEEIRRHSERLAALYEIHLATTSTLELRGVLHVLLERLSRLVPGTVNTIMLVRPEDGKLMRIACRGADEEAWKADCGDPRDTSHPVLDTKAPVVVPNIQAATHALQSGYFHRHGYVSYLGVPLLAKDDVLGVLSFYCADARQFSDEEIQFIRSLAGQAAAAIDNSQLYEQARRQAIELEKANRVKNEFLGVMSHELRTPLNVISGYTKIIQDGFLGAISADQSKALGKVTHHANELLMMVNSIMDATKIEVGALSVDCNEFFLAEFLNNLKPSYEYPLAKDVTLRWDWPADLPYVRTDGDKLKHVLQNLINNALKFTEEGCVTVSARYLPESDTVEITVVDTGVGIDAENLPLIFERFRQLDSSQTRTHGGVGLGLHIVKTFVGLLCGNVTAASMLGKGSEFRVTLPRWFPEGAPTRQPAASRRSIYH